jgi:DNA-binding ferritin-like protein (Dps family)
MHKIKKVANEFLKFNTSEGYPKDMKNFINYLKANGLNNNIEVEFLNGINTRTVIKSLEIYIDDNIISSVSTAKRYVACIKEFLRYCIGNDIIKSSLLCKEIAKPCYNEKSFSYRINKSIAENKMLHSKKEFKVIDKDEMYELLLNCDRTLSSNEVRNKFRTVQKHYNKYRSSLIIKLIIIAGLPYRTIRNIKKADINFEDSYIKVNNCKITIMDKFKEQLKIYYDYITENSSCVYLFLEKNMKRISTKTTTTAIFLAGLTGRSDLNGIIKPCIVNLIEEGISTKRIMKNTGIGNDIINECHTILDDKRDLNNDRYSNCIRNSYIYNYQENKLSSSNKNNKNI